MIVKLESHTSRWEGENQRHRPSPINLPNVTVYQRSGAEASLPSCDAVYVSAGSTAPLQNWLDALRPGGRLLVPLTPDGVGDRPGLGGMLLVNAGYRKSVRRSLVFVGGDYPLHWSE